MAGHLGGADGSGWSEESGEGAGGAWQRAGMRVSFRDDVGLAAHDRRWDGVAGGDEVNDEPYVHGEDSERGRDRRERRESGEDGGERDDDDEYSESSSHVATDGAALSGEDVASLRNAFPARAGCVFGVPELALIVVAQLADTDLCTLAQVCKLFNVLLDDPLLWQRRFRARWRRARPHRVWRWAERTGCSLRQLYAAEAVRERALREALTFQWFDPVAKLCYEAVQVGECTYDVRYTTLREAQLGLVPEEMRGGGSAGAPRVYWRRRQRPHSRTSSASGDDSGDSSVSTLSSRDSTLSVMSAVSTVSVMSGLSVLSVVTNHSDSTIVPYSRGQLEIVTASSFSLNGMEFVLDDSDPDEAVFINKRNRKHRLVRLSGNELLRFSSDDDDADDGASASHGSAILPIVVEEEVAFVDDDEYDDLPSPPCSPPMAESYVSL
ncbi:uncharacterized protein AMSG_03513 [Thecamonas trahens ATCC 50062]|uniref:F-box domain-containing protein n=1 Tax=Thecamonas trahens ATCC 50062 TaxID=461836 RepID=A0A0L0D456_THETB|nr:hypothetical protein AMSG_03513 [Thecamonas trahens ATCC 50062]KNC47089.1 hypothetical protein AMSG_03513 [Thecamonas trahens ATCC 50062]|eukprot:XP_013759867.1 hypothetical protein AMSG_03513 [Thecamonas trahens ATCC 50062]